MLEVKGFVQIPSFINNTEDAVAAIGELGLRQRTYAKDRQHYQDATKDASELVIFSCKDNGSTTTLPSTIKDLCLDIMEEAYNNFVTNQTFLDQLVAGFPTLTNVNTGVDMVHNGRMMNEWFSFEYSDSGTPVTVKLWLSNLSFAAEYDEYDIIVIQPTTALEDYHDTYQKALDAKNAFTASVRFAEQSNVIGSKPPTDMTIVDLNWVDPTDAANTVLTEWTIIGYGEQAFVYENMLEAIRQHLLDNSSHDLASWVLYFPELDNIDIMYLFPQWENVALTSSTQPGVGDNHYASYARYDTGVENLRKILTGETLTTMKKYIDVIFHIYKSIALFAVGKDTNTVGTQRFSDIFPQYTVLNLNDINNGRLPADVTTFITLLNSVLVQAEIDDGVLTLPAGMVRQNTGGANFIEVVYNNVTYRVCTKDSYLPFT